ncbi:discs, large-associated protein 1 [Sarotherodon galilaeus]
MPDPATQQTRIIRTVESLCDKWLHCSREEEREELARQVGVCVSVFPWLWETLHPLISDFLVSSLRLCPQQQLPGVRESSPEPCSCIVTPLPREPEAVRVGTVRLTADTPSVHASSASASSPSPDCTTRRTEMPEAIDFGEEEKQQVLQAYREDELRWKPWLISEEELSPAAPSRTCRPPSPPRSDCSSPASYLARMWSEDEELVAVESQVLSTAASRRKRRSRRRRASLRPVLPSTEQHEDIVEGTDFDLEERQRAACAQLEEELQWEPWLAPNYEEIFRGTRLALGGPVSFQELSPTAPSSPCSPASATPAGAHEAPLSGSSETTIKKRRRARRRRTAQRPEVSECSLLSSAPVETLEDELDSKLQIQESRLKETHSVKTADSSTENGMVSSSGFYEQGVRPTQTVNPSTGEFQPVFLSPSLEQEFDCPAPKPTGESPVSCVSGSENKETVSESASANFRLSNAPLTEPQPRDFVLKIIMDKPSNLVGTSDTALSLKKTSTDLNVNCVGSGVEVFSSVSCSVPGVPSQTELSGANASLPESTRLTNEQLEEGPCAFIASKAISEEVGHDIKYEGTECEMCDHALPAVPIFDELKTENADHELTLIRQDENINADHGNLDCVMPQHEFCLPEGNKQGDFELFCPNTIASNQEMEADIRVNVTPFSPVSVNPSLDKVLTSNNGVTTYSQPDVSPAAVKGSSAVLPVSVSQLNIAITLKPQITTGAGSSKCLSIPECLMFVQEPHPNGLNLVFVGEVAILVFRMAKPAPLSLTLPLIRSNKLRSTPPVTTETGPFAFKPVKTDADPENLKLAGTELVVINTAHFMDSCAKIVSPIDCFSPALSPCGIMPQQPVFPQLPVQLAAQLPVQLAAQLPVQLAAQLPVQLAAQLPVQLAAHHASATGCPGVPARHPAAFPLLHASSAGGPEEPVQPHATSAGGISNTNFSHFLQEVGKASPGSACLPFSHLHLPVV